MTKMAAMEINCEQQQNNLQARPEIPDSRKDPYDPM